MHWASLTLHGNRALGKHSRTSCGIGINGTENATIGKSLAFARGECGLPEHKPKALTGTLGVLGLDCTIDQAKNARRSTVEYGIISYDDREVRKLMHTVADKAALHANQGTPDQTLGT